MRLFVLGWLVGCMVLQREAVLPELPWLLAGVVLLLACALTRTSRVRAVMVIVASVGCGFGYGAWRSQMRLADDLPFPWEGAEIEMVGLVSGLPQPG